MKQFFTLVCVAAFYVFGYSQPQILFQNQPKDAVVQLDPRVQQAEFLPGEILIRYKDDVVVSNLKISGIPQTGVASIDQIFQKYAVHTSERLFPNKKKLKSTVMLPSFSGREFEQPNLHNIYKLQIQQPYRIFEAIEELNQDPNVLYAEPNYILSITNTKAVSPPLTESELKQLSIFNSQFSIPHNPLPAPATPPPPRSTPNDPLYSQQWGIPVTNIDDVWDLVAGADSTQVIGILDTGVDWLHPDLANKIWTNTDEIPGNGIDDDGNGKIDDIRGWDFINNDNNPQDDNSHGTHCAGIAAAQANNNIGISGVSWGARIMPIKVFQSSGQGDAATIAQGVTYAATNGATVLSMSFGTYAESQTLKMALANAYATAVLVGAGGNDGLCIGPGSCPDLRPGAPLYPGAYNFVLGVEATKQTSDVCGMRACFSNFDQDGPVFSTYPELLNYELKAPGQEIISCVPGGNYRVYSGTSMATPLVAGAIALYRALRPGESIEMLFGNLINTIGDHLDLEAALNAVPTPVLNIVTYEIADTLDGDRDDRVDAGETIEFRVTVRNTWGETDSVKVGISFHEFEDTTTATILTREAMVGSISAYATLYNEIPLKVHFAPGLTDGREIVFDLTTWYDDHQGEESKQIVISVENGVELGGIISSDLTLYPAQHYIITEHLAIPQGVTLTIKPGTTLKVAEQKSIIVAGSVVALGTKDSLITFTKRNLGGNWKTLETTGSASFHAAYSVFEYAGNTAVFICNFSSQYTDIKNCLFTENSGCGQIWFSGGSIIEQSCFYYNQFANGGIKSQNDELYLNNIVQNTNSQGIDGGSAVYAMTESFNLQKNNIFSNINTQCNMELNICNSFGGFAVVIFDSNYYGTTNADKINNAIYDFPERGSGIWFDISKKLDRPLRMTHGIVWKIEVNGKDAQDQFEQLDPLGVGQHTFNVYFNRPMDVQFNPIVSMGVRYPYTQTAIATNGSWSSDSTVYTVYGSVGLTTGDGINKIRVAGAKDPDHFEIPVEDRRFRVIIKGAGSLSAGFMATPGMGKVMLEWCNPAEGVNDLLGYNMYRYSMINDTVSSDTVMLNPVLLTDTVFTDFNVEPGTRYFYAYKTARTNLTESDLSRVVTTIPLTSSMGDANGDLCVNVLDVTAIISYIIEQDPQPFIFEAADVNLDSIINVLDLFEVINIIQDKKKAFVADIPPAYIYFEPYSVQFKTSQAVSGLQFEIEGRDLDQLCLYTRMAGFELITTRSRDKILGLLYSYDAKPLPVGLAEIFKTEGPTEQLRWGELLASDPEGNPVKVIADQLHSWSLADCSLKAYPNPFNQSVSIGYVLYETAQVEIMVIDLFGRTIAYLLSGTKPAEPHIELWNGNDNNGNVCNAGVYLVRLTASGMSGKKVTRYAKLLKTQ